MTTTEIDLMLLSPSQLAALSAGVAALSSGLLGPDAVYDSVFDVVSDAQMSGLGGEWPIPAPWAEGIESGDAPESWFLALAVACVAAVGADAAGSAEYVGEVLVRLLPS